MKVHCSTACLTPWHALIVSSMTTKIGKAFLTIAPMNLSHMLRNIIGVTPRSKKQMFSTVDRFTRHARGFDV